MIRGHDNFLPPEVVRCVNCHGGLDRAKDNRDRIASLRAPRLDKTLLLEPRQRRGGPPSVYNQTAFCKLLRTGVDPAWILVAREMPVYDLDEARCASLWRFVTRE